MKKIFGCMLVAVLVLSASAAFAQCGACPAGEGAKVKAAKPACCAALEKLTLTDDQKTKVAELQKECKAVGCSVESRKKMAGGLKGVLTDEQYQQWEKTCAELKKSGGCPMSKKKTE